jgi:hypothetical protein
MTGAWAQVRIYALPEVAGVTGMTAPSVLEARFQMGLIHACAWAHNGNISCALCGNPLDGNASYLAVLMPLDERWGLGTSSAVCAECGRAPRAEVLRHVEYAALLMFGPEGGHA